MPQNFAQYFRALQILFFALLIGQISVVAVLYVIHNPAESDAPQDATIFKLALTILLALLSGFAFFMNRKKLESARAQTTLKEKLTDYRTACIIKWAPLEAGALISAVLFFVTGNAFFLGFATMMIVFFATQFPSRQRLINELDLTATEQMALDDPNAVVYDAPKQ